MLDFRPMKSRSFVTIQGGRYIRISVAAAKALGVSKGDRVALFVDLERRAIGLRKTTDDSGITVTSLGAPAIGLAASSVLRELSVVGGSYDLFFDAELNFHVVDFSKPRSKP